MKRTLFVFIMGVTAMVGCQKLYELKQDYVEKDFFYRIKSLDASGAAIDSSFIVSTKIGVGVITGEFRGEANTGDKGGHHDGDGCDDTKPDFCQKHPWHKKCTLLGLKLTFFEAQKNKDHVLVAWKMENEGSTASFAVDRSEDGKTWITRKIVKAINADLIYGYKDYSK